MMKLQNLKVQIGSDDIFFYVPKEDYNMEDHNMGRPSVMYPILQSYLDLCVDGYMKFLPSLDDLKSGKSCPNIPNF